MKIFNIVLEVYSFLWFKSMYFNDILVALAFDDDVKGHGFCSLNKSYFLEAQAVFIRQLHVSW